MATHLIGVTREATKFDCEGTFALDICSVFPLDDILGVISLPHVTQLVPTTAEELKALQKGPAKNSREHLLQWKKYLGALKHYRFVASSGVRFS